MKHRDKHQNGFTIVELLIVIVVIGILAAITIVSYNNIQYRAKAAKAQSQAHSIADKAGVWQALTGNLPSYGQLVTNSVNPSEVGGVWTAGSAAGPTEAKLSADWKLVAVSYPMTQSEYTYIVCTETPVGAYVVYRKDASSSSVDVAAIAVGGATGIVYGSIPFC